MRGPTLKGLIVMERLKAEHTELSGAELMRLTGIKSGTMYPLLQSMEKKGWLTSRPENGNPHTLQRPLRRLYSITFVGLNLMWDAFHQLSPRGDDL